MELYPGFKLNTGYSFVQFAGKKRLLCKAPDGFLFHTVIFTHNPHIREIPNRLSLGIRIVHMRAEKQVPVVPPRNAFIL